MRKRKRLPIEQLREAGRIARQMLVDRGELPQESIIDQIMKLDDAPTLPGIPSYLPHQWTIKAAQRMMRDLLIIWKDECRGDGKRAENITEFFKFIITELRKEEKRYDKEMKKVPKIIESMKDVPVLKDIFSPMRKKESMKAIQRFFVDSFAVSVALKNNYSTSDYANWFLDWSQDLYILWVKPEERKIIKRV